MDNLDIKLIKSSGENPIQFTESHVQAGFPSPAQGSFGDAIDLNRALIDSPTSTFCARVSGNSMIDAGIENGASERALKLRDAFKEQVETLLINAKKTA